jgi:hypothetical protein
MWNNGWNSLSLRGLVVGLCKLRVVVFMYCRFALVIYCCLLCNSLLVAYPEPEWEWLPSFFGLFGSFGILPVEPFALQCICMLNAGMSYGLQN